MPRLDPATRNIAIDHLQAGESQNEVARTPQHYVQAMEQIPTNWFNE